MAEVTTGNEIPPNVTIYINNLNEKIKLEGTDSRALTLSRTFCFARAGKTNRFFSDWLVVLQSWRSRCTRCSRSSGRYWRCRRTRRWSTRGRRGWSSRACPPPPMRFAKCRAFLSTTNPWYHILSFSQSPPPFFFPSVFCITFRYKFSILFDGY